MQQLNSDDPHQLLVRWKWDDEAMSWHSVTDRRQDNCRDRVLHEDSWSTNYEIITDPEGECIALWCNGSIGVSHNGNKRPRFPRMLFTWRDLHWCRCKPLLKGLFYMKQMSWVSFDSLKEWIRTSVLWCEDCGLAASLQTPEHDSPCKMAAAYKANPDFFPCDRLRVCFFFFFSSLRLLFVLSDAHLLNHTYKANIRFTFKCTYASFRIF